MGDGLQAWNEILPRVAEITHAVSYDRLGLGRSGPPTAARNSFQIATELDLLLVALRHTEPVLLVSHSAGAFHARMFAHRFPQKVAGFVFAEPSREDWLAELKNTDPKAWVEHLRWRQKARHAPGRKRELAAWDACISQMREIGSHLPPVPTTIISATAGHASATEVLFKLHQRWAAELPHVRHIVTSDAGHYVHKDAPDVVVNAVSSMVEELRSQQPGLGHRLNFTNR